MTRRRTRPVLLVLALCAGAAAETQAIPRYSAQYRQNCTLCHANPSGGGLRSLYASQYLVPVEMALFRWKQPDLAKITPNVSESVTIGTDLRTMHFWSEDGRAEGQNFFQMQGDVYLAFQPSPRFYGYLDRSQFAGLGNHETFAVAFVLPWNGYVKAGRFAPDFGWKFEDHTRFTREIVAGQPRFRSDTGIEIGAFPGHGALSFSAVNGAPGAELWDSNDILAYTARGLYRLRLGGLGLGLGGSYWIDNLQQGRQRAGGPFGYADLWKLTWIGEADWSQLDPRPGEAVTALATSHELSLEAVPGFHVLATYDFADPDLDLKSGVRIKYGIGLDVLATPFAGLRGMVVAYRDRDRGGAAQRYTQSQIQLHVYY